MKNLNFLCFLLKITFLFLITQFIVDDVPIITKSQVTWNSLLYYCFSNYFLQETYIVIVVLQIASSISHNQLTIILSILIIVPLRTFTNSSFQSTEIDLCNDQPNSAILHHVI